jgi:hypothetical protein
MDKDYSLLIIGDTGMVLNAETDPVFQLLNQQSENADTIAFLGDNVYPKGLPPLKHSLRKISEAKLLTQLKAIKDFAGKIIFISGNHDWNKGKKNGYKYVLRQQKYVETFFHKKDVYLPSGGCPGPVELNVSEFLTIIVINTQWWVQSGFRPAGKECGCQADTEEHFFKLLGDALDRNKEKRIIVLGHLPLKSYGMHGGKFLFRHHLFPFTLYHKKAFFPLPFLGSALPLYRKYFGAKEDISHPRYRRLKRQLLKVFNKYPGLIYAAGHDHNLQHIEKDKVHFIISGSGSTLKYVRKGAYSKFTHSARGFFKLVVSSDRSIRLEAWEAGMNEGDLGKLAYEAKI